MQNSLSRREMLEKSMIAATLAAVSYTPDVRAEDKPKEASPNEKIRIAILGVNGRGGSHIGGYINRSDCDIVAVVDPDEKVGMSKGVAVIEKKSGKKPAYYQDLRKVLDDKNIDVISVATPNHWHSLATIWGCQAGKDVYVEKPISHNVLEGRRAVQAARKYNRIVQCGTQSRSHKALQEMVKFMREGKIGEVQLARGLCYKPRGSIGARGTYDIPVEINYDVWFGPAQIEELTRPKFHYDWHWQWNCGNGDSGNQGIHQMDIARWGLGVHDIGNFVYSYGGRFGYEDAGDTPNTQISVHEFTGGKRIIFETRGLKTDKFKDVTIGNIFEGTEGYAMCTSSYGAAKIFDKEGKEISSFNGGDGQDHFDNFIECVKTRDASKLNGEILEGHLSSALCHVANNSYRIGKLDSVEAIKPQLRDDLEKDVYDRMVAHLKENTIDLAAVKFFVGPSLTIDPVKEVFTGENSAAANKLMTREYRAPYLLPTEEQL